MSRPRSDRAHSGCLDSPGISPIAMTPVPRQMPAEAHVGAATPLKLQARSSVARFVLRSPALRSSLSIGAVLVAASVAAAAAAAGCAVPPSLQLDEPDARVNSAPIILSISDSAARELVEPGPVSLEVDRGSLSLILRDTDLDDTLYVRFYADYNAPEPTPALAACRISPSGTVNRTLNCLVDGLCTESDVGRERNLWIEVFDREVLESGTPRYRAMPAGGASTKWQFRLNCKESPN